MHGKTVKKRLTLFANVDSLHYGDSAASSGELLL